MGRRRGQLEWCLVQPKLIISCAADSVASLVLKCHHKATCSFKGVCKKKGQCSVLAVIFLQQEKKRVLWPKRQKLSAAAEWHTSAVADDIKGFFQRFNATTAHKLMSHNGSLFMFLNHFFTIRHGCVPSGLKAASSTTASVLKAVHDNKCWLIIILHDWI